MFNPMVNKALIIAVSAATVALSACTATPIREKDLDNAHYWQRASASDAIYQRGPKALQMLHRDISRCVVEIKELERMGTLRKAMPADNTPYNELPAPKGARAVVEDWDTPEREGALYAEMGDYYDFESCMNFKGWERIDNVPYDVEAKARETFRETILRKSPQAPKEYVPAQTTHDDDFSQLND